MSTILVSFNYNTSNIIIQAKDNELMKDIYSKFFNKVGIEKNDKKLYFSYNGKWGKDSDGTENLTLSETANEEDKKRKKMNILVAENLDTPKGETDLIISSDEIICPICGKYSLMDLDNYKISLHGCENNHTKKDIILSEFLKSQYINLSKIVCSKCNNNRSNIFKNEMYKCFDCNNNICPLCKSKHDNSHRLEEYDKYINICKKDLDYFTGFCKDCGDHYCMSCEEDHI